MSRIKGGAARGSALVVAMLVTAILALLGISFLVLAETERRIAENEQRAAQALYVAEAGLRAVKRWFDDPGDALGFPPAAIVDRSLRRIVDESAPRDAAAAVPADGLVGSFPYYKQGQDVDGDGLDDLLDRPYRGTPVDALRGTADGPDLRIDDESSGAATFLAALSSTLVGAFPGEAGGVHARISRIDVYAPPYERFGATWQRGGVATVAVTARIYQDLGGAPRILAERRLEGVLGEAPYRAAGLQGALQSCKGLDFVPRTGGDLTVRWGALAARGAVRVGAVAEAPPVPASLPRTRPPRPGADSLFPEDPVEFEEFRTNVLAASSIDDPWFRILAGGAIEGTGGSAWPRGSLVPATPQDYSNLLPNLGVAVCPTYDYRIWKTIAQSGGADVHYFAWTGVGDSFRENGREPARGFREITHGQTGVYFFDTRDGDEPEDADANGVFDNLTPAITVTGGDWNFTGFLFLNAQSFRVDGVTGVPTTLRPPGEPFIDVDDDGQYDAGEPFVNLDYGTATATDGRVQADPATGSRDARGPELAGASVSFHGLLYSTGAFEATGAGTFYGAVVAEAGVTQNPDDGTAITPVLIWDGALASDWPPEELPGVPRVVITDWQVPR